MTPETIAELRRLLDNATARPWMVDDEGDDVAVIVDEGDEFSFIQIAADLHQGDDGLADARLIAAAVNALPDLLDAADERDELAATVERVRAWLMSRGVDVSDRDGDYMDGYRAAQRHAVQDAAALLAAIDGDANDEPEPNPDDCPVCDVPRHHYHRTNEKTGAVVRLPCKGTHGDCDDEGTTESGRFTYTRCYYREVTR